LSDFIHLLKMKKLIFFIVITTCLFAACESNNEEIISQNQYPGIVEEIFEPNEYNTDMKNFALAVSNAMNKSEDFRKLIKREVLAKFDGDYNVLLSHIMNKSILPIEGIQLRSSDNYTVKDLLEDFYVSNSNISSGLRASGISVIEELSAKYPLLEVSVPVHADEWESDYIPVVTFIPSEYEDGVTQSVTGYNPNGSITIVDAISPPKLPLVVVKENEKLKLRELNPEIPWLGDDYNSPPPAPTNLTASATAYGVALSWTKPSPTEGTIGYYICRKGTSDQNFVEILIVNGVNNIACYDNTAKAGESYWYHVKAYNYAGQSESSNTVSAVGVIPANLLTFDVNPRTEELVELNWTVESANYVKIRLDRYVVGNDNGYKLHKEFDKGVYDYFEDNMNLLAGKKIQYRIQTISSAGSPSNPKYDFLYMPYRNPTYASPVKIKKIKCSNNVEGFLMGTPEILITVLGVDSNGKTTEITSFYSDMKDFAQSYNHLIFNWQPRDNWYQRYTFYATEEDPGPDVKIKISANIGVKKISAGVMEIEPKAGIETEFKFSAPEDMGSADLSFYDPINTTLKFEKHGYWCLVTLGQ